MIFMVVAIVGLSYYAVWKCYAPMLSSRSPTRALLGFLAIAAFTALVRRSSSRVVACTTPFFGRV